MVRTLSVRHARTRGPSLLLTAVAACSAAFIAPTFFPAPAAAQQQPLAPDDAAVLQLNGARRAFDDGKFPVAVDQFKQFLSQNANHREAPSAQYGLGLALLQLPQRDYQAAADALQKAAAAPALPERPFALYYLGAALRGQGNQSIAQAAGKPPAELDAARKAAQPKFDEAAKQFAAAVAAFN